MHVWVCADAIFAQITKAGTFATEESIEQLCIEEILIFFKDTAYCIYPGNQ